MADINLDVLQVRLEAMADLYSSAFSPAVVADVARDALALVERVNRAEAVIAEAREAHAPGRTLDTEVMFDDPVWAILATYQNGADQPCTCGFGGFHDDANPRCEKNGAGQP